MRAGLSTIQQTLTPEAANVLTHSIAEASRRNHGQTTPLHVAATLLAAPSGLLRQACVRSHPHSSHPLQCRALELCFSVALDRLPSSNPAVGAGGGGGGGAATAVAEPPISNALMAALKRAQAHQRRGCPEQQQQPLLAVKVELEQLLISILDDPSVSRVMREASFSSTAVKAAVEQSLASLSTSSTVSAAAVSPTPSPASVSPASPSPAAASLGLNFALRAAPNRNLYMNPRLHQHQSNGGAVVGAGGGLSRTEEVRRVIDILLRAKKRHPVLVGDSDPEAVMREVLQQIESGSAPPPLNTAKVVSFAKELATTDRSQIPSRIRELRSFIESNTSGSDCGVVVDLGDLKWLVESPTGASLVSGSGAIQAQPIVSEVSRAAVAEIGKLLKMFEDAGRLWLVGTASCATYLRCQVYHPTMENDCDLQAVPIAPRSTPRNNMLPRLGGNGILSSSVETLSPIKGFTTMGTTSLPLRRQPAEPGDPSQGEILCPVCMENYERELAKLVAKEFEKSSLKPENNLALPQWLQLAKLSSGDGMKTPSDHLQSKEQELLWKQSTEDLLKRWHETCSRLHPNIHPVLLPPERPLASALSKPLNMFSSRPSLEPKLSLSRNLSLLKPKGSVESISLEPLSKQPTSPPGSPVRTDLVLGNPRVSNSSVEKTHRERVEDLTGCMQDNFSKLHRDKIAGISDIDTFKRLFKGLIEKVGWQQEAASTIATVVMQCRSGNGRRQGGGMKGDIWLLFVGPDRVGKRKMATALSELVFGSGLTIVGFNSCTNGSDGESSFSSRGRTSMDRVVDAVCRNPFSVIMLEDVDRADGLVRGTIKRAIERGRLPDSYGREVSLGSVIFILTARWVPEELKSSYDSLIQCEEKLLHSVDCGWQLELSTGDKSGKRHPDWLCSDNQPIKLRKESSCGTGLSLDLNLAAGVDDEAGEGSRNSSELTTEHELARGRLAIKCSIPSAASELMELVDNAIMFKPVDFGPLRRKVLESISMKFATIIGTGRSVKVDDDVLDRIVGCVWLTGAAFDEWVERVLIPSLKQLKSNLKADYGLVVSRLSLVKGDRLQRSGSGRDGLPESVAISVDGL